MSPRTAVDPQTGQEVPLSPTRPMNPQDVAHALEAIRTLGDALEDGVIRLEHLTETLVDAQDVYERAYNTRLVELAETDLGKARDERLTVDMRKAKAGLACADEKRAYVDALESVRVQKRRLDSWSDQLGAFRTVAKHVSGVT